MNKKILIIVGVVLFGGIFASGIWYIFYLDKAHSTFLNYYDFRGCTSLVEMGNDYGICKTRGGENIKIVKYKGRWYLNGDLPSGWFNFL